MELAKPIARKSLDGGSTTKAPPARRSRRKTQRPLALPVDSALQAVELKPAGPTATYVVEFSTVSRIPGQWADNSWRADVLCMLCGVEATSETFRCTNIFSADFGDDDHSIFRCATATELGPLVSMTMEVDYGSVAGEANWSPDRVSVMHEQSGSR